MARTRSRSNLKREAEVKFPVRVRIELPDENRTKTYNAINEWLRNRYGPHGYAWTGGVIPGWFNASLLYFPEAQGLADFMKAFPEVVYAADSAKPHW